MKSREWQKDARQYLAVVDAQPTPQYADRALNNAAVALENLHQYDAALRLYERILRDHPKSELAAFKRLGVPEGDVPSVFPEMQ